MHLFVGVCCILFGTTTSHNFYRNTLSIYTSWTSIPWLNIIIFILIIPNYLQVIYNGLYALYKRMTRKKSRFTPKISQMSTETIQGSPTKTWWGSICYSLMSGWRIASRLQALLLHHSSIYTTIIPYFRVWVVITSILFTVAICSVVVALINRSLIKSLSHVCPLLSPYAPK